MMVIMAAITMDITVITTMEAHGQIATITIIMVITMMVIMAVIMTTTMAAITMAIMVNTGVVMIPIAGVKPGIPIVPMKVIAAQTQAQQTGKSTLIQMIGRPSKIGIFKDSLIVL